VFTAGDFGKSKDTFFVGVVARLTLFDGGRTNSEVRQAEARLRELLAREQRLALDIELAVRRAYLQLTDARERLQVAARAVTQAEVTIQVSNTAPVAVADFYSVVHDRTLAVAAPGVLANDRNWDGDTTTLSQITGPSNGMLSLNADGSFSYTPNAGFVGTDTFTYRLADGVSQSGVATVTIQVTNDVPTNNPRLYQTHVNTALTVGAASGLLAGVANPDGDSLSIMVVSGPAFGTLNVTATTGAFTYTPNAGFLGSDSFTYRISDGVSHSEPITVTLAVRNNTPEVAADTYLVQPGYTADRLGRGRRAGQRPRRCRGHPHCHPRQWSEPGHADSERGRLLHLHAQHRFYRHRQLRLPRR
jgi:VCBS repeat-containing protein